ncbi:MAG: methionine biosynthesis protein MetW [Alphaproteobacteria bacterium RIFCSPLOWO2_01_FULL_40_26]|nr:MAG: methionine biosynthesis protein MetW [Alphaproteobacteria bacterium RIFCSPHIGHO2_02_FULL_40_34]OFW95161.1 MAG: methionine biosynthesis protein MetW [Alphaproteobacteria bacterium RIFCSPLOWO2_01_FULL_40_26]OFX10615.1 MAG: methionine biosynthesis protein MetW [Alphaproteobacteria bacterium RIFCSPLOWO2_02_FULL_40_19]OFX11928.1 MAG: methionine biosynthesis protein MetW [Alphaproteobacteria bacterium RIFCSPLOWO2_12_FULL_40_11]
MTTEIGQNIVTHQIRYDLEIIASLIKPNSKVLDIGCGSGELLQFLREKKNVDGRGLEISQQQVSKALMCGLSVIHGDAENDLGFYPDNNFDYAILSQTIQATHDPKKILTEMLRIAEFAIVSLPNFAHFKNRLHLLFKGTMPVNKAIPFEWHDTPNIHFCSIRDFEKLCESLNFSIKKKIFLTAKRRLISFLGHEIIANLFAEYGIFLITKKEFGTVRQEKFAFKNPLNLAFDLTPRAGLSTRVKE